MTFFWWSEKAFFRICSTVLKLMFSFSYSPKLWFKSNSLAWHSWMCQWYLLLHWYIPAALSDNDKNQLRKFPLCKISARYSWQEQMIFLCLFIPAWDLSPKCLQHVSVRHKMTQATANTPELGAPCCLPWIEGHSVQKLWGLQMSHY